MERTYASHTLPGFVLDYVGRKGVVLTRVGNTWTLAGDRTEVSVHADNAVDARSRIRDLVSRLEPKTDRRRKIWNYT